MFCISVFGALINLELLKVGVSSLEGAEGGGSPALRVCGGGGHVIKVS